MREGNARETVCRPTHLGGPGVLHLENFARTLRFTSPWFECKDPRTHVMSGYGPFYASTTITIGNGEKETFWDSIRLHGRKPKDIAPLISAASKRKKSVKQALHKHAWIMKINMSNEISMAHILEFVDLWDLLNQVHLNNDAKDDIRWKLLANGGIGIQSTILVSYS